MIIDENQLSSAHNNPNTASFESNNKKQLLVHNNRPKRLSLMKVNSYLSMWKKFNGCFIFVFLVETNSTNRLYLFPTKKQG